MQVCSRSPSSLAHQSSSLRMLALCTWHWGRRHTCRQPLSPVRLRGVLRGPRSRCVAPGVRYAVPRPGQCTCAEEIDARRHAGPLHLGQRVGCTLVHSALQAQQVSEQRSERHWYVLFGTTGACTVSSSSSLIIHLCSRGNKACLACHACGRAGSPTSDAQVSFIDAAERPNLTTLAQQALLQPAAAGRKSFGL